MDHFSNVIKSTTTLKITVLLKISIWHQNEYQYGCGHRRTHTHSDGHSYRRKDRAVEVKFKLSTMSNKLRIFTLLFSFFLTRDAKKKNRRLLRTAHAHTQTHTHEILKDIYN